MSRVVRLMAWVALVWSCSAPQTARPGAEGALCKDATSCQEGLVCKAAQCSRLRSMVGGVCVTEAGCSEGLACVGGRCSKGIASEEDCRLACGHLSDLLAIRLEDQLPPPEAGATREAQLIRLTILDFGMECRERCKGRASVERSACMRTLRTLDALETCP